MKICQRRFYACRAVENIIVALTQEEAIRLMALDWPARAISEHKIACHKRCNVRSCDHERYGTEIDIMMYCSYDDERGLNSCCLDIGYINAHVKTRKTRPMTMVKYAISTIDNAAQELFKYEYHKDYYVDR